MVCGDTRREQAPLGKLSIRLDPNNGEVVVHKLTDSDIGDLIYETVGRYQSGDGSTIITPPRRTATFSDNVADPGECDRHIKMIHEHGRMAWQEATDDGRRPLVEMAFGRYKPIIGDSLSARDDDAQVTEVAIGIKTLNRMIIAAKPISVRA